MMQFVTPVGVMLGCCTAQRAVQWSLLTNDAISRVDPIHINKLIVGERGESGLNGTVTDSSVS